MPTASPPPEGYWVSMRHVQRAVVMLKAAGLDAGALLAGGGISQEQLADGNARVPLSVFETLFSAYQGTQLEPLLGLRMAETIQPSTLGSLGLMLQNCGTLADVLEIYLRFRGLLSNVGEAAVNYSPGRFEICWTCVAGGERLRRDATEYVLGGFSVITRMLVPDMPPFIAVQFTHAAPKPELAKRYFDFFGCPVYFNRPHASITAPSELLQMRLPYGDAVLKDLLVQHARRALERQANPPSLTDDVRRLIQSLLVLKAPTMDAVAAQLGLSTRSLHRRLEEAGTSYREILDAVRLNMAQAALVREDEAIADLAERLSFSSPQAFMRWFKALVGMTPGQYRAAQAGSVQLAEQ